MESFESDASVDCTKLQVIFASYRDWAQNVGLHVFCHPHVKKMLWAQSQEELIELMAQHAHEIDLVLLCGWSWPPEEWMVNSGVPIVSEHPAASDRYSPGTPLQNQILDGLTTTKHRIVKVGFPELSSRLYSHEVDMSLEGNMDEILDRMRTTSIQLFDAFLREYPRVSWKQWPAVMPELQASRRADSSLSDITAELSHDGIKGLLSFTTQALYDKIRCLGAPYPNAYVEDETGRLYFEKVRFEPR